MAFAARKTSQVLLHMAVAFAVMYAFTGSLAFGGLAAIVEPVCNVLLLPLHDRVWRAIERRRRRAQSMQKTVKARRLSSVKPPLTVLTRQQSA